MSGVRSDKLSVVVVSYQQGPTARLCHDDPIYDRDSSVEYFRSEGVFQ